MELREEDTVGDAAVDGLIYGLLAGIVMLAYLVVIGWINGRLIVDILSLFSPGFGNSPAAGGLSHLAVSSIYGAGFGIVSRRLRGRGWALAAGLAYGLLLVVVANAVLIPGFRSTLGSIDMLNLTIAHLIYGLVLGGLMYRSQDRG